MRQFSHEDGPQFICLIPRQIGILASHSWQQAHLPELLWMTNQDKLLSLRGLWLNEEV
jgi:hypothetical protein